MKSQKTNIRKVANKATESRGDNELDTSFLTLPAWITQRRTTGRAINATDVVDTSALRKAGFEIPPVFPKPLTEEEEIFKKQHPPKPPPRRHYPVPVWVKTTRQTAEHAAPTPETAKQKGKSRSLHFEPRQTPWYDSTFTDNCGCVVGLRGGNAIGIVTPCGKGPGICLYHAHDK